MTLVDTNVLLDLVTDDPNWADWSVAQLEAASLDGPLPINDMIYAELAVRYGGPACRLTSSLVPMRLSANFHCLRAIPDDISHIFHLCG